MSDDNITPTGLRILRELDAGTLKWGAAVGACWPSLVRAGYVEPNFGKITELGREAARAAAAEADHAARIIAALEAEE
jgi:hypothetical protein